MKQIQNEVEFKDTVKEGIVLVDFFATWCGPCRMLAPELEQVISAVVVKVDVDDNEVLKNEYEIMSVPTLILLKDGELVDRKSGYLPKDAIEEWIQSKTK